MDRLQRNHVKSLSITVNTSEAQIVAKLIIIVIDLFI